MDINIACPICGGKLTDRFGCKACIVSEGTSFLETECVKCDKLFMSVVSVLVEQKEWSN